MFSCFVFVVSAATGLPFHVTVYQDTCRSNGAACVEQTFITLADGTIIEYPNSNGFPSISSGTYNLPNTAGTFTVSNRRFEGSYVDPNTGDTVTMVVQILGSRVVIEASDCILERACGLCGTSDRDTSNDIHVRIGDTNSFNILGTSNEDRHEFGDSWCNEEITQIYGDGNCTATDPDSVFVPEATCISAAESCCVTVWNNYCQDCETTGLLTFDEFLDNCAFDGCAMSDNGVDDDTCNAAIGNGFFDFPIDYCQGICGDPTPAPTFDPTPGPTVAPTPDCDNEKECYVSNDPHFRSWDRIWYDYHGVGYFDYVAPCNKDDYSLATGIPFRVTVRQERCISSRATPTCVKEVFITVVDGSVMTEVQFDNIAGTCMFLFV